MRATLLLLVALLFNPSMHAASDCQELFAQLADTQEYVDIDITNIGVLEAAIADPGWNVETDGWMVGALDETYGELTEDLNAGAILRDRLRASQCY